jgi:G3E family GTPase
MDIIILSGFLGSGKTTFLAQLIAYLSALSQEGHTGVAVIENEIGKFNIDGDTLGAQGIEVREILSGCACCTVAGDLVAGVESIKEQLDPHWLVIEASGMGIGSDVAKVLLENCTFITSTLTLVLVDAKRFGTFVKVIEPLITSQLKGIDLILLNKVDLVSKEELAETRELVKRYNDTVEIVEIAAIEPLGDTMLERMAGASDDR